MSLANRLPAACGVAAVMALVLTGVADAKLGHFFGQRGRTYDAAVPLGQVTDWRDQSCASSFLWVQNSGQAKRWTADWRRVNAVRVSTGPKAAGDPAASVYGKHRGVVMSGEGAFRSENGQTARSFEVVFNDRASGDGFLQNVNNIVRDC